MSSPSAWGIFTHSALTVKVAAKHSQSSRTASSVTKGTWHLNRDVLAEGLAGILVLSAAGFQADEVLHLPDTSVCERMRDQHPCRVSLHSIFFGYHVCTLMVSSLSWIAS